MTQVPDIETARLILKDITDQDLNDIYRGLSNPRVIRHYGVSFNSLEETRDQMEWFRNLKQNGTGIWWTIRLKAQDKFIGACGLNNILSHHKRGEIGFWLLPEYWGQGYISEALPRVLNYGVEKIGLHRIEAYVETENKDSIRVLKKHGFQPEGRLHDYEIKNGNYVSLDVFARIS